MGRLGRFILYYAISVLSVFEDLWMEHVEHPHEAHESLPFSFRNLPEKPCTLIRLFERGGGEYYCLYGDDALFVADRFYKTSTALKYIEDGGEKLPICTIPLHNACSLLRNLLLEALYSVEIWALDKTSGWRVIKKASPANLAPVEDLLFKNSPIPNSVVLAARIDVLHETTDFSIGVAYTDSLSSMEIVISEFVDNESLSNLESIIVQVGVKELLVQVATDPQCLRRLEELARMCGMALSVIPAGDFNTKNIQQDLGRLLNQEYNIAATDIFDMSRSLSAVAALISYLGLLSDERNFKQYSISLSNIQNYMRLDSSAFKALNLLPTQRTNSVSSIYGLLNQCKTSQGSRLLMQWIKQPLMSIDEIERRYNLVEIFYKEPIQRKILQEQILKKFPDIYRLVRIFSRNKSSLQDVVKIYQVVMLLPELIDAIDGCSGNEKTFLEEVYINKFKKYHNELVPLIEMIENTIDLQAIYNHEFIIKPDFDPGLKELRTNIMKKKTEIEDEAKKVAKQLGMDYEKRLKLENNSSYGYYLRLSRKDATSIRGNSQYSEYATRKDGVYFTNRMISRLNNEFTTLSADYNKIQSNLAREIMKVVSSYSPILLHFNSLVAHLDVLISFAHASAHSAVPYARPKLHPKGTGKIYLKDARHPCIEAQSGSFVSNCVDICREKTLVYVVTGPNMGGKSTYIRMIGCICLLAHIGCFVPAREAEISIFDSIMARVGAWDNQVKGISTFMVEMLEASSIIKSSTKSSLIIIDELGRGTSTYDGFGLAWSILEHIINKISCPTLFATHYHELTKLEEIYPQVGNLHAKVLQNDNDIVLLYKIVSGSCDRSFGITAAEMAGFPKSVIKMSKLKAMELESFAGNSTKFPHLDRETLSRLEEEVDNFFSKILDSISNNCGKDFEKDIPSLISSYHEMIGRNEELKQLMRDF